MVVRQPKYSNEEAARRGNQLYEEEVKPKVKAEDHGKFVAIDMDSGQWEIDVDDMAAEDRLLERMPAAQIWMTRVGLGYAERFGQCLAEEQA